MPAGCDFICKNEKCEHKEKGFTLTAPWPMGKIELVINAPNVKENKKFRKGLVKLKNDGKKYACITYPNTASIDIIAYQVNLWCKSCPCLWKYDVILSEGYDTFEGAYKKAILDKDIPEKCPTCNEKLFIYDEVLEEGVSCPSCKKDMRQDRWMAKEVY